MTSVVIKGFNEGRACDAIIRRIEARDGHQRDQLRFPEREGDPAPVEMVCRIGDRLFAFEHTGIEPFEKHIELEAKAKVHFGPIQDGVAGRLPETEHFELLLPVKATLELQRNALRRVQATIVEWVVATAPTLPIARLGRYVIPLQYTKLPEVPFEVFLTRASHGGALGRLSIKHLVGGMLELEEERRQRIRRAYENKMDKLSAWQQLGARAVLILEENDIQMTNHQLVADAIREIESGARTQPDEIYLVSSGIAQRWDTWALRVDALVHEDRCRRKRDQRDLSVWGDTLMQFDPTALVDLTHRV
jgi:hypothetical protein